MPIFVLAGCFCICPVCFFYTQNQTFLFNQYTLRFRFLPFMSRVSCCFTLPFSLQLYYQLLKLSVKVESSELVFSSLQEVHLVWTATSCTVGLCFYDFAISFRFPTGPTVCRQPRVPLSTKYFQLNVIQSSTAKQNHAIRVWT